MENVLNFKGGEQIKNIIKIQNTFRTFQFHKKQKELLLSKLTYKNQPAPLIRIRQNNFQSLINKKIRNLLKEIIKIDSLDYYNIDNFLETFDNLNFDHSKIHNNMKKKRIKMYPVSITNKGDSNEMNFYWGEWDLNGNMEGFGIKIFSNGGFYFGTFKKNKMDGIGIYLFPNKGNDFSTMKFIEKEDQFDFQLSRSINYTFIDKFYSKNEFIKCLLNEEKKFYIYIGEFKENNLQGYGQLFQNNKDYYLGEFYANETTVNGYYHFNSMKN